MFKKIFLAILILVTSTAGIIYFAYFYNKLPDLIITDYKLVNIDRERAKNCSSIDPIDCAMDDGLFTQLQLTIKNIGNGTANISHIWVSEYDGGGISESNKSFILPGQTATLKSTISSNFGVNSFKAIINNEIRARRIKESNYENNSILINQSRIDI